MHNMNLRRESVPQLTCVKGKLYRNCGQSGKEGTLLGVMLTTAVPAALAGQLLPTKRPYGDHGVTA